MTVRELLRFARRHRVSVRLDERGIVMVESDEEIEDDLYAEVVAKLRPFREEIRAFLQEFRASASSSDAVVAAQALLREGITAKCPPSECGFHVGKPGDDCRRCGLSWAEHAKSRRRQRAT